MSDLTWSDIAYQERHGYLPDKGSTASEMTEYWGDPSNGDYDPDHVREVENAIAENHMLARIRELETENRELRDALYGHDDG